MSFLRTIWLVVQKDLLIELRSKEILFTTVFFAISCVLVFSFGFVQEGRSVEGAAAGILWIAIAFSGTLALGRAFERERQNETLRALMIAPVDRPALYLAKLIGVLLLLFAVELLIGERATLPDFDLARAGAQRHFMERTNLNLGEAASRVTHGMHDHARRDRERRRSVDAPEHGLE